MRRILSTCIAGATALGLYYNYGVAAPAERVRKLRGELAELNDRISKGATAIMEVRILEQKCSHIRAKLARRGRLTNSPLLWFPEQMSNYFSRFGVTNVATRVNTSVEVAGLPGYQRTFWAVTLPLGGDAAGIGQVLRGVSELEAADPHVRVQTVSVTGDPEALGGRSATINVSVLTRQF